MREKKVLPQTIEKYIDFLDTVRAKAYGPDWASIGTIEDIVENCHINKSVIKPMEVLGLIRRTEKHQWEWLAGDPDKDMVLKLLDMVLHQRKKATVTPLLPDFATQIEPIVAMLRDITANQKELLREPKTGPLLSRALNKAPMDNNHLFTQVEQRQKDRVYVAGQLAGKMYPKEVSKIMEEMDIPKYNALIISITDDLLSQLYTK